MKIARYLAAYAIYVAALHLIPGPWQRERERGGTLDLWTLTHVAWGAIGRRMGLDLGTVTGLAVLNELGELAIRRLRPDLVWGFDEPPANRLLDVAATAAGWYV